MKLSNALSYSRFSLAKLHKMFKVPFFVFEAHMSVLPGNTYRREKLSTIDLLLKVACFVKVLTMFTILKATHLNRLVLGGQLY